MAATATADQHSFEELALPFQEDLRRIALKLTRRAEDADDLVQDVFLRATRYFKNFRAGTNFRAWILTILRTTFIDERRKRSRRPSNVDPETLELLVPAAAPSARVQPGSFSYREEDLESWFDDGVREALLELPHDFRQAFLLATVGDFTYHEIAEIMNCPGGTVRSRVFRSRRLLRKSLQTAAVA
jgi:RNA polymerase sigma-70 factor (ECF subfamily)